MIRKLFALGLLAVVSTSLGCAMCCSPDDPNYAAYGGRWQRHDMAYGRVGSAFAEAGYDALAPETLTPAPAEDEPEAGDDGLAHRAAISDDETDLVSYIR